MPTITLYDENGNPVEVELPEEQEPKEPRSNDEWATLRKERKAREQAERKIAFMEAGVSTTDPKMAYFVKGYDGDLKPESIKAAATEAGFLAAEGSTPPAPSGETAPLDPGSQAALEAGRRIASAGTGATLPGATTAQQKLQEAYLAGGTNAMLDAAESLGITVVREQ